MGRLFVRPSHTFRKGLNQASTLGPKSCVAGLLRFSTASRGRSGCRGRSFGALGVSTPARWHSWLKNLSARAAPLRWGCMTCKPIRSGAASCRAGQKAPAGLAGLPGGKAARILAPPAIALIARSSTARFARCGRWLGVAACGAAAPHASRARHTTQHHTATHHRPRSPLSTTPPHLYTSDSAAVGSKLKKELFVTEEIQHNNISCLVSVSNYYRSTKNS